MTAHLTLPRDAAATAPAEPRARFRDLLAAEWLKLWSLRSTPWTYAVVLLAVVGFNTGTAYDTYRYWTDRDARSRADFVQDGIALQEAFTGNAATILVLAAGAVGAITVTGEYGTGLIRTTFAAVPARRSVMAAKAAVLAAVTTVLGALIAVASFATTQAILSGRGLGVPFGHPGALRVITASALLLPVGALTGMAIGTLVRHMGTTIVLSVVTLLVLPVVFSSDRYWSAVVAHAMPLEAWQRLTQPHTFVTPFPWSTGGAWTVYAAWAAAAVLITVVGVHRRDQ
ncbi:ABC-2 family transporter protein [Streptomyces sp. YIM 121038]|uniref:ABC transporter permease n=1 Tax=Streptomyces sp. YIM 121038 TaxID=2136401 RepID=UPI001110F398|nr:ABC transporter permease [Streptomyces sp. YIM 121038]QCX80511.1 ABC-2 family transporter protein [Streptomyces sp. YIM 121038]